MTDLKEHNSYTVYKKIREYNESREVYLRDKLGLLLGLERSIEEKIRDKLGSVLSNTDVDKLTNKNNYSKDRFKSDVIDIKSDYNLEGESNIELLVNRPLGGFSMRMFYDWKGWQKSSINDYSLSKSLDETLKSIVKPDEQFIFKIEDGYGCVYRKQGLFKMAYPKMDHYPCDESSILFVKNKDVNINKEQNFTTLLYVMTVIHLYYFYQALSFLQARKILGHFPSKNSDCFKKFDANTVVQLRRYIKDINFGLSKLFEGKNLNAEVVDFKNTLEKELSNYLESQLSVLFSVNKSSIESLLPSLKATEDMDLMKSSTPYEVGQLLSSVSMNKKDTINFVSEFVKYYKKYTSTHRTIMIAVKLDREQLSKLILAFEATNELQKAITRNYIVMKFMEGRSGDETPQQFWEKLIPTIDLAHAINLMNIAEGDVKDTEDALESIKTRLVVVANKNNSVTPRDIELYTKKKSQPDKTILDLMVLFKANKSITGDMNESQMDVFIDTGSWSRWAKNKWSWKVGVGVGVLGAAYLGYKLWNREVSSSKGSSEVENRRRSSNRKSKGSNKTRSSRRRHR